MQDLIDKIQLEKSDYRMIKASFEEFMLEASDSIERAMIKQIPEFSELSQERDIIVNRIENAMKNEHFNMFQQYQTTMDKMSLIRMKVDFCLGMKLAKGC